MQLQQTVVYLLLIAIAPAYLFPHRSSRHLNIEQPRESTAATTTQTAETGSLSPSSSSSSTKSMDSQQQKVQDKRKGTAAARETLNSPSAAVVVSSADDYRKPAFVQHMKQFMENSNINVVYVIDDNDNSKSKQKEIATEQSERSGRQFYPIVALDDDPATKSTPSAGTGIFSIMPIAFDWRQTIATPLAAIYAPATAQTPLRIWAIGSVAKFPPFIEHFVQRIQAHYSIYKYEDLSRPGFHQSGGSDQVVRVSTSSKKPAPVTEAPVTATKAENDEKTSTTSNSTITTIATTTSKV